MKPLQLGINYGMGVPSLAKGLDRHPLIASTIIELHKRTYPRFWEWRANRVQTAMLERRIETEFGWTLHLSHAPNKRTLHNFPMQGNGAEMLRLAAWRLCEAGIIPNMLIHDGVLLEVRGLRYRHHSVPPQVLGLCDIQPRFRLAVWMRVSYLDNQLAYSCLENLFV
jgi:DNA polymerase I-like protein with 3'-5' exonuclease and polymerase domains